jgi:hypothetical protein
MYTSNKVMQVCIITALHIKMKKKTSFVIIKKIIRLVQIQSHLVSTRVMSGPLNTRGQNTIPLHTTKGSKNTNAQKRKALW